MALMATRGSKWGKKAWTKPVVETIPFDEPFT
jgi:hypothetical protein